MRYYRGLTKGEMVASIALQGAGVLLIVFAVLAVVLWNAVLPIAFAGAANGVLAILTVHTTNINRERFMNSLKHI